MCYLEMKFYSGSYINVSSPCLSSIEVISLKVVVLWQVISVLIDLKDAVGLLKKLLESEHYVGLVSLSLNIVKGLLVGRDGGILVLVGVLLVAVDVAKLLEDLAHGALITLRDNQLVHLDCFIEDLLPLKEVTNLDQQFSLVDPEADCLLEGKPSLSQPLLTIVEA